MAPLFDTERFHPFQAFVGRDSHMTVRFFPKVLRRHLVVICMHKSIAIRLMIDRNR